ncbi:response regulator transcription factor [Streptomyces sp. NPDC048507]|uniref:helix-turn-helix transcriptional regulator n=1 Tax=Streptomyces sp. NPDC048507 TaxID=3365560 RepID=UPI00372364FD
MIFRVEAWLADPFADHPRIRSRRSADTTSWGICMSETVRSHGLLPSSCTSESFHGCEMRISQPASLTAPDLSLLTLREREVLHMIGLGETNRLLARRLRIAERTVKAHVSSIISKLELRSRGDATTLSILHHAEVHASLDLPNSQ